MFIVASHVQRQKSAYCHPGCNVQTWRQWSWGIRRKAFSSQASQKNQEEVAVFKHWRSACQEDLVTVAKTLQQQRAAQAEDCHIHRSTLRCSGYKGANPRFIPLCGCPLWFPVGNCPLDQNCLLYTSPSPRDRG